MWQKLLNIILILTAFIILFISIYVQRQQPTSQETKPPSEGEVGMVDEALGNDRKSTEKTDSNEFARNEFDGKEPINIEYKILE